MKPHRVRRNMYKQLGLLFISCLTLHAQELSVSYGKTYLNNNEKSYSYEIEYNQPVYKTISGSIIYLNEGHFKNSHKDLTGLELWKSVSFNKLSVSIGYGIIYCYDTEINKDIHTTTSIASLSSKYYISDNNFSKLTVNKTKDTTILIGLGHTFNTQSEVKDTTENKELSFYIGQQISNSAGCPSEKISLIEYKNNVNSYLDWTVSAVNTGIASQIWAVKSLKNNSLAGSVGIGPYINDGKLNTLLSFKLTKQINKVFDISAILNRAITQNNKDADIIVAGIGYKF